MSTIIIPILTALVGGFVAYYFGVKAKRDEAIYKYKEEKYAKLLPLPAMESEREGW